MFRNSPTSNFPCWKLFTRMQYKSKLICHLRLLQLHVCDSQLKFEPSGNNFDLTDLPLLKKYLSQALLKVRRKWKTNALKMRNDCTYFLVKVWKLIDFYSTCQIDFKNITKKLTICTRQGRFGTHLGKWASVNSQSPISLFIPRTYIPDITSQHQQQIKCS